MKISPFFIFIICIDVYLRFGNERCNELRIDGFGAWVSGDAMNCVTTVLVPGFWGMQIWVARVLVPGFRVMQLWVMTDLVPGVRGMQLWVARVFGAWGS